MQIVESETLSFQQQQTPSSIKTERWHVHHKRTKKFYGEIKWNSDKQGYTFLAAIVAQSYVAKELNEISFFLQKRTEQRKDALSSRVVDSQVDTKENRTDGTEVSTVRFVRKLQDSVHESLWKGEKANSDSGRSSGKE